MRQAKRSILCVIIFILLASCQARVTYHGDPVTHPTLVSAARAIHAFDLTAASIARFFLLDIQTTSVIPEEVVLRYAQEVGPHVQKALDVARRALLRARERDTQENIAMVSVVLAELAEVMTVAQELAQEHGW